MINWRAEGDPVAQGLSIYHFKDPGSAGFILNLDRWYIRLRYSKIKHKFYWECVRREPRAWRMLKAKNDRNY